MLADGVRPSNEGRGYVLRRLLRRAARHGKLLGIDRKFLADMCKVVISNSGDAYPELVDKQENIIKTITAEEERFYATLDAGIALLNKKIDEIKATEGEDIMGGEDSFKMYDTYGFPLDLMQEILGEAGITVDEAAFKAEMDKQRKRAREARGESTYMGADETIFHQLDPAMSTEFLGYDNNEISSAKVLAIVSGDEIVDEAHEGDSVVVITDKTPFYAEMGGQCGDSGVITDANGLKVAIEDCTKFGGNKFLHTGVVESGTIKLGASVDMAIDTEKRLAIARNHTATHILQAALREVLGAHIEQAGSLVDDKHLRFDFTHFEAISKEDLNKVERIVNEHILAAHPVDVKVMSIEEAKKTGATALFGEKYGDTVRVVNIDGYSIEFCGGTHLKNSAQAGSFKLVSESGVSAGVRRIEALTGTAVLDYYEEQDFYLREMFDVLKTTSGNALTRIKTILEENKAMAREIESLKAKLSGGLVDDIIAAAEDINGIKFVSADVKGLDMNALRTMGDQLKDKVADSIVVLASGEGDKVSFVVMCSDAAVKKGAKAGDIVKAAATVCGGGGGGRPNMAQAGGKDASKIGEALAAAKECAVKALA
jgi:alanyl-tRNA synthetase